MIVNGTHYLTLWMEGTTVRMIDQNALPFKFEIVSLKDYRQTALAIKDMTVRGAGALGVAAGFAMAQAFNSAPEHNFKHAVQQARFHIESMRPTAKDLFYATKYVFDFAITHSSPKYAAIEAANQLLYENASACEKIGQHGAKLIRSGMKIETHCNAGWLAFADWGSALAPMYAAKRKGKDFFVWVDETRPRSQGARLTAWELHNEKISHSIIPDNAAAHYMSRGEVDLMIVGADRIVSNGDFANKIGTMEKAICAKEFGIPFYVAAPLSTFDLRMRTGHSIPIEERSEDEVLYQTGPDAKGKMQKIRVASPGSHARNPGFDVTPAKLVKGIITEQGIIKPGRRQIRGLFH